MYVQWSVMSETREERWAFRVPAQADRRVRQAADVSHRSLTAFVLDAAIVEADRVLTDQTQFALGRAAWEEFAEALEQPARSIPALAELFAKPSVFE